MSRRTRLVARDPVVWVWIGLVLATVVSWLVGTDVDSSSALHGAAFVVVALGLLKARFIGLYFMELRRAPRWLRTIFECWILAVFGVLVLLIEITSP